MPLTAGMVIDGSITIRPGTYLLVSKDIDSPAIVIRGERITVDFGGAVLEGGPPTADPDGFTGTGILIDGGSHVTLKNPVVRGYKVGIRAQRSPDLRLTANDVSYNWKQRLHSGIEKESLLDWMSYHQNDKDEWLRFGAGIYLRETDRAEVDHNTAVQGQNGLIELILDAWEPHGSRVDRIDFRGGRRKLRVEYYEIGGWSEMRFDIQKKS